MQGLSGWNICIYEMGFRRRMWSTIWNLFPDAYAWGRQALVLVLFRTNTFHHHVDGAYMDLRQWTGIPLDRFFWEKNRMYFTLLIIFHIKVWTAVEAYSFKIFWAKIFFWNSTIGSKRILQQLIELSHHGSYLWGNLSSNCVAWLRFCSRFFVVFVIHSDLQFWSSLPSFSNLSD